LSSGGVLQCVGRLGVRQRGPFDALEQDALAAGQPVRSLRAHGIAIEPLEHPGVGGQQAHRPGADRLRDRDAWVGGGEARGHHHRQRRGGFAEREQHRAERRAQAEAEAAVIQGVQRVQPGGDGLAHTVARHPAPQTGHRVGRHHAGAVVEAQPVAQPEGPVPAVIADLVAGAHLRLRLQLRIHAIQRVPHQQRRRGDVRAGIGDRVERAERVAGDEPQHPRGLGARVGNADEADGGGGQEVTTPHPDPSPPLLPHRDCYGSAREKSSPRALSFQDGDGYGAA
jgi:hypothetical protein